MKKLVLICSAIVFAICAHSQSKKILLNNGTVYPSFQTLMFDKAWDTNPYNYQTPESSVWEKGNDGIVFQTTLAMLYNWGGKTYFTPTNVVGIVAKLIQQSALAKDKPNLFLVEVAKGKLSLAIINYYRNGWEYSAISPMEVEGLPKGAVLYTH